jgi:hypothetical protein
MFESIVILTDRGLRIDKLEDQLGGGFGPKDVVEGGGDEENGPTFF